MTGTIGVGLIGTGGVATLHANAVGAVAGLEMAGAFSRDPENVRRFVDAQGGRAYENLDALLRDDAVEVVAICSPPPEHVPQAVAALRAGKHVLVEKPIAATLDEIDLLEREAEQAGRLCMPCHNYVYDPVLIRGRELAREGKFGRLASFWLLYNQAHDASAMAPGITLRRLCIHHAYAVLFFLGRPSTVVALSGNARSPESRADDQVMMAFKTDAGALATVWGSFAVDDRTRDPWTMIYKLLGTEGGFSFSWGDVDFREAPLPGWDRAGYHESFRHVYEHLANRCLAAGEPPLSTLTDARDALSMIEAAERALDGAAEPIAYR